MYKTLLALSLMVSVNAHAFELFPQASAAQCSRYCNPEVSKPCGQGCITKDFTCRKSWTTACVGVKPKTAKPGYENPKHVDTVPTDDTVKK